jgi:predicted ABC-type transport system involved in lysophospholipase L1 biosynthesis ATPase subunit
VTHEARVANRAGRMIRLADGAVVEDVASKPGDSAGLT